MIASVLILPLIVSVAGAQGQDRGEFFESRIRPLLANYCYTCHTKLESGGLRLDSLERILKGGSRGPAIIPGRPEDSLLIKAVTYTHEKLKMPPTGKLSDEEIADLIRWIRDGAFWPESPSEFFANRIRPLLVNNCLKCHSSRADAAGGLSLDSREAMLKGGKSGPAIVPGDPDASPLIRSVRHSDKHMRMPPDKQLTEQEIADLAKWIKDGAVWADGPATAGEFAAANKFAIAPEQKAFWAFQPPREPRIPVVRSKRWSRNPIDRFIFAKLEQKGLKPAPRADKRTLIRRATYDLTGLPPTPEQVEAFLADESPNAFEKVIDRLLASPRYGERWGRHWLDLVRYADTAGDSADYPIPQAYLYRDYVIDSFNKDKPYDQFIREQIAGDLLPSRSEEQRWERIIATGYIAIARRFSVRPERNMHLTIEDTIDNMGKTFLGLTISCARCHDHKYDPISTRDYYALYGIFDSTRYPFAGSENDQEQKDLVLRIPQREADVILKPYREKIAPIEARMKELEQERTALMQGQTASDGIPMGVTKRLQEIRKEYDELRKKRREIIGQMPQLEKAFAVSEATPRNARIHIRGDPKNLGDEVPRRFLEILGGYEVPPNAGSGRLQLAEWLADPNNPLTARVMVNRIWQHHFGKGIVRTPSDFGRRGKPPTHPELLDYLALRFIQSGWSIKAMHKLIMLSETYQLSASSKVSPENARIDPDNELLWRFNRRRLDAEEIRDSLLMISGQLDARRPGPHPFPGEATWAFTQHKPFAAVYDHKHRSVYLMVQRIQKHPYLATFDGPDSNFSTAERTVTVTPLQALFMMNSQFVNEAAEQLAERLIRALPETRMRIDRAHRMALGRPPTSEELRRAEDYLRQVQSRLAKTDIPVYRHPYVALASYLKVLLSSNEFLFVD